MKFHIAPETIKETTNCLREFKCLESECELYCKVKDCLRDEVHFIECMYNDHCEYRMDFGKEYICTCPIRKAIYNRYKV